MDSGSVPDFLRPNLKIVFVGFNPGILSGQTGYHFASPTNRFWKILYGSGLTPRLYTPAEAGLLLDLGYGLTNIVPRSTRAASDITSEEFARGRSRLLHKLGLCKPRVVCLVGKGVYQVYAGKRVANWGYQIDSVIPGIKDFVAPNSSGLVRMSLDQLIAIYRNLQ
jgi:TDG/mug DNA glycosylase family protein